MAKLFGDYDSTKMRLHNTVCFLKREPVFVILNGDHRYPMVSYIDMKKVSPSDYAHGRFVLKTVDYSSKDFSYESPPLGFVNDQNRGYCYLVERRPLRRYKQAICYENLITTDLSLNSKKNIRKMSPESMFSNGFVDMLLDKYPSKREALGIFNSHSCSSIAISKNLALLTKDSFNLVLFYRFKEIGMMNKQTGETYLYPSPAASVYESLLNKEGYYDDIF